MSNRAALGFDERLKTMLELRNSLSIESEDHLIRVTVGEAQAHVSDDALYLEALVSAYSCLWRAHPPIPTDSAEWQIDIWMLPRRRKEDPHRDVDTLALQALAATSPPYRSTNVSYSIGSENPTREFAFALWSAIDIARACRELECAVRTRIPVLPEIIIEQFHRSPDDEITWMEGILGVEAFTLYQHIGRSHKAVLTIGKDEAGKRSRKYEAPVAEGWYGNQVFVNTLAKIVSRMQAAGDNLLVTTKSVDDR